MTASDSTPARGGRAARLLFPLAIALLVAASVFAGVALAPALGRWRAGRALLRASEGEIAALLEHAAVDVRRGRGATVLATLRRLAPRVREPATRERLLALTTEAAVQAGQLATAELAEREREALVTDPAAKRAIQLRRVALLGALKRPADAEGVAQLVIDGARGEPAVADEARLRLAAATKGKEQLAAWVKAAKTDDAAEARAAGLAALHLAGDAAAAERLLAAAQGQGQQDPALLRALLETYQRLKRPKDVVRVAAALGPQIKDERESLQLAATMVLAMVEAGAAAEALARAGEMIARAPSFAAREAARRLRYEVLQKSGGLDAEVKALEKQGDRAERAFVALALERNYPLAERLYGELARQHAASAEYGRALDEARRARELAKERDLYLAVLARDPKDRGALEKLLAALVGLGDVEALGKVVGDLLKGQEQRPAALLEVARLLARAGLAQDAARLLERAHGAETDAAKQQQIRLVLADLYAEARQVDRARRLYSELAARGVSPAIREHAMGRLAALLGL